VLHFESVVIHGSVEDTKLSTNKQHTLSRASVPPEERIELPEKLPSNFKPRYKESKETLYRGKIDLVTV